MGSSISSAVFSRHCSFQVPLVPINEHGLSEQHFTSYEDIKNCIDDWIASKDEAFFRRGIHMLPERWEKVVVSDHYFE